MRVIQRQQGFYGFADDHTLIVCGNHDGHERILALNLRDTLILRLNVIQISGYNQGHIHQQQRPDTDHRNHHQHVWDRHVILLM
ncbi:hypothetical protein D3C85_1760220 [compost metagenome]